MANASCLTGKRFGKLVVLGRLENNKSGNTRWLCVCDCGKKTVVVGSQLTTGKTQSCGCKRYESHNRVHGMTKTDIYKKWRQIKQRCLDKNCKSYQKYGAIGITICDEWKDNFVAFMNWSYQHGYKEGLSLDRIDNAKGYSTDNCRWITWKGQCNNRRSNIKIAYQGKTQNLSQWCEELNLRYQLVWERMRRGMTFEEAITKPLVEYRSHPRK